MKLFTKKKFNLNIDIFSIRNLKILMMSVLTIMLIVGAINIYVLLVGSGYKKEVKSIQKADAIIVLGAFVDSMEVPSWMLQDRLNRSLELYKAGKAPKIIVSGDHGRKNYDEVNAMRTFLQEKGVKREVIFMDHAGFDTYDTMVRAREVFCVKSAIVVTQGFHMSRALYIARRIGLTASGVTSDIGTYPVFYNDIREIPARLKAFVYVEILRPKPKFLGVKIPITGNGEFTDDGKS